MAWIESHQSLATHRKTKSLKRLLRIKTPQAIGHLHLLWYWCLDNAPSGDLSNIPDDDLAEAAEWSGDPKAFISAVIDSGFIDPETRQLHDWTDYTGSYFKQKALTKEQRKLGGTHRMAQLSPEARSELGKKAIEKRWSKREIPAQYQVNIPSDLVEIPATVPNSTIPNSTSRTTTPTPSSLPKQKEVDEGLNIFQLYETEVGVITPMISDNLKDALERYPPEWFKPAFKEAADLQKRSWRYIETILENWKTNGFKPKRTVDNGNGRKPAQETISRPDPTVIERNRQALYERFKVGPDTKTGAVLPQVGTNPGTGAGDTG